MILVVARTRFLVCQIELPRKRTLGSFLIRGTTSHAVEYPWATLALLAATTARIGERHRYGVARDGGRFALTRIRCGVTTPPLSVRVTLTCAGRARHPICRAGTRVATVDIGELRPQLVQLSFVPAATIAFDRGAANIHRIVARACIATIGSSERRADRIVCSAVHAASACRRDAAGTR